MFGTERGVDHGYPSTSVLFSVLPLSSQVYLAQSTVRVWFKYLQGEGIIGRSTSGRSVGSKDMEHSKQYNGT